MKKLLPSLMLTKKHLRFLFIGITVSFMITAFSARAQEIQADFSPDQNTGCDQLSVIFTDNSSGDPTVWKWDFGNGQGSSEENPSTNYTGPGTYKVTLAATNGVSSDTKTSYITVYENPAVSFSLDPHSGCYPLAVQFTDQSTPGTGTITKRAWDFGDGTPFSNDQNPAHTYTEAGKFNVKLSVTNSAGCTKSIAQNAAVITNQGVTVDFTADDTTSCTAPLTVNFTASTSSIQNITYTWDFGDGNTGSGETVPHEYKRIGSYTVTLTAAVNGGGCKDIITKKDYIQVGTYITDFEIPKGCANVPLTFKNISSPLPASATWSFGDGGTATGINATHSYNTPGTYEVTLINDYGKCQQTIKKSITTYPSPKADLKVTQSAYCDTPAVVSFQNLSQGGTSWKWLFGDSYSSTGQQPTHSYLSGGNFDVTLIASNTQGCIDTASKPAYIKVDAPNLKFNASPGFGCVGMTSTFTLPTETINQIQSFDWDFGDGTAHTTEAKPLHQYTKTGAYTVTLNVVTKSGCKLSFKRNNYIHIGDPPTVNFITNLREVCLEDSVELVNTSQPSSATWEWRFPDDGDTVLRNIDQPFKHRFHSLGPQDVTLIVSNNGCTRSINKTDFITVKEPKAAFKATLISCIDPYTFDFKDDSKGAQKWHWDFGDGDTSIEHNLSHTYTDVGAKKVTLTATNDKCSSTATGWIQIANEDLHLNISSNQICKGDKVTLTADNIRIYEFINSLTWTSGDGDITTTKVKKDETPKLQFTYNQNGSFTPDLIVNYVTGCKDTVPGTPITVQGPKASFKSSETEICQGMEVSFIDQSKLNPAGAAIQQWIWNYEVGKSDTTTSGSASHTYTQSGHFTTKLRITDANGCTDVYTSTQDGKIIVDRSKADFSASDTMVCPGTPIQWNNRSNAESGTSYIWDFGDGNTSTEASPNHSYSKDSLYTVKLYLKTDKGCEDSLVKSDYIRVGTPLAIMQNASDIEICREYKDTAISLSENYTSLLWDFGDGTTSSRDTAYHIYNIPGTYTQTLTVKGYSPGCVTQTKRTITITGPIGEPIIDNPYGCSPHTVNFSARNITTAIRYQWFFGDGNAAPESSDKNATYTYRKEGLYHPTLKLTDATGCYVIIPITDTLNVIVDSIGLYSKYTWPEICDSNKVQFNTEGKIFSRDSLGEQATYQWDFGDPATLDDVSADAQPAYRYTTPGIYYPSLKISTKYGCQQIIQDTITIPDSTILAVTATTNLSDICAGESVQLNASSNIGEKYVWFPAQHLSNPDAPDPLARPETSTTYEVTTFSKNNCQSNTAQVNIVVHQNPEVDAGPDLIGTTGSTVQLQASGSNDVNQWSWEPTDYLSCTNCANPVSTPKENITYTVTGSNSFGCTTADSVTIHLVCDEGKVFIPNTFTPNGDGQNDIFYPRGLGVKEVRYFRIYNRLGQLVYERTYFQLNEISAGWNGTFKGQKLNPGVFAYTTSMVCDNNKVFELSGNITLLR